MSLSPTVVRWKRNDFSTPWLSLTAQAWFSGNEWSCVFRPWHSGKSVFSLKATFFVVVVEGSSAFFPPVLEGEGPSMTNGTRNRCECWFHSVQVADFVVTTWVQCYATFFIEHRQSSFSELAVCCKLYSKTRWKSDLCIADASFRSVTPSQLSVSPPDVARSGFGGRARLSQYTSSYSISLYLSYKGAQLDFSTDKKYTSKNGHGLWPSITFFQVVFFHEAVHFGGTCFKHMVEA